MAINKMGQCKLVDGLIKDGLTDEQIVKKVKDTLPGYPEEKIKPLIKIRRTRKPGKTE